MKLLYIHEKVSSNGTIERLSQQFDQDEIILGRGGSSHIILPSRRVSLTHAKIFREGTSLYISDLGSFSGVRVNNAPVSQTALSPGDLIQLGDLSFLVQRSGDLVTLTHRSTAAAEASAQEVVAAEKKRLVLDTYLPRMSILSIIGAVIVFAGCFAYPMLGGNYRSWNSGPISNAHRVIEKDCQRCHSTPFQQVQDAQCSACHTMSEHAPNHEKFLKQHGGLSLRCAQCHMEHNGDDGIISKDTRLCVSCHGGMKNLNTESSVLDVASFTQHPQFRISVKDESGNLSRVSLDDRDKAVDTTPIKLNHALHLKQGLRGPNGPETLQCNACHQLSSDETTMMPISFDKHCRDCHSLGFDERLPDSQVPHGNSEAIYPTLFSEYAKLLLLNDGRGSVKVLEKGRAMPEGTQLPAGKYMSPDVQRVQADARSAEEELFTRTGCFLCHNYNEKPLSEQTADGSRYTITKPGIPDVWLTKARFEHGAHEAVLCESCHENVRKSKETRDVLLPKISVCRECHMQDASAGFVQSECVACHVYHKSLEIPHDKKQSLTDFLHSLTR